MRVLTRIPLTCAAALTGALLALAVPVEAQRLTGASEELRLLYEADQADRRHSSPPTPEAWAAISERDQSRRSRVIELLRADSLSTGEDYYPPG